MIGNNYHIVRAVVGLRDVYHHARRLAGPGDTPPEMENMVEAALSDPSMDSERLLQHLTFRYGDPPSAPAATNLATDSAVNPAVNRPGNPASRLTPEPVDVDHTGLTPADIDNTRVPRTEINKNTPAASGNWASLNGTDLDMPELGIPCPHLFAFYRRNKDDPTMTDIREYPH